MNAQCQTRTGIRGMNGGTGRERAIRPLTVKPALRVFILALRKEAKQGCDEYASDALGVAIHHAQSEDLDSISVFERILNGTLDTGYRGASLIAFVFAVLRDRIAARVLRRMAGGIRNGFSAEVEDLVSVTMEAIQVLIRQANRERHTLTYALLLSIADHRTIDFLRRKRPELNDNLDVYHTRSAWNPADDNDGRPDNAMMRKERIQLARRLRRVILKSVNDLPYHERAALIMVEVESRGYDEIAEKLSIKRTDVGNLVRRARLRRDRNLMPMLRTLGQLEGHIGFSALQAHRSLRINLLRWTTEMGDGVCGDCLERGHVLHTANDPCIKHLPSAKEVAAISGV